MTQSTYISKCSNKEVSLEAIEQRSLGLPARPPAMLPIRLASHGLPGLGWAADLGLLPTGGFPFAVLASFCVFVRMVRWWLHPGVRIRYSPPYPHSVGASSASGGRVELCVGWISWDLVGFRVRRCGCRSSFFLDSKSYAAHMESHRGCACRTHPKHCIPSKFLSMFKKQSYHISLPSELVIVTSPFPRITQLITHR